MCGQSLAIQFHARYGVSKTSTFIDQTRKSQCTYTIWTSSTQILSSQGLQEIKLSTRFQKPEKSGS
ncbi:hypothetical protein PGT21_013619 [Puccinia graminis f. sp. tritici]|nr:hypothetical protein PGT21_013619 [Puccinia graminis f. sp. tritici]